MRLLFAGGGTAGHINPAIALANHIAEREEQTEILFVGTREGMETDLVPQAGYPLEFIKIHGFDRSLTWKNIKNIGMLPKAVWDAEKIIRRFRPDAVIGTGGYVCGPVLYAASRKKIPTLVHESNALPGITTKLLAGAVDTVAVGMEDAERYLAKAKHLMVTGTPIRPSLLCTEERDARRRLGLDERPFLVFFGGSLGAEDFNKTVTDWICQTAADGTYQIMMGTGKRHQYENVMARFRQNGVDLEAYPQITVCEYIYDMHIVMQSADVVICRAGASTLCELTALGKASVLVPSPYVADNHQEHNARAVEHGGGAKVICEAAFTPQELNRTLEAMTADRKILDEMKRAAKAMGHTDASEQLYREIKRLIEKR